MRKVIKGKTVYFYDDNNEEITPIIQQRKNKSAAARKFQIKMNNSNLTNFINQQQENLNKSKNVILYCWRFYL